MLPARIMLCLALALGAQAADRPRLGFDVHLDTPLADLKADLGGKVGAGASFLATFDLGPALSARPRLDVDVQRVSRHRRAGRDHTEEVNFSSVGIGADLLGTFAGTRERGFYWSAGAGLQQWFQTFSATDSGSSSSRSRTETRKNRLTPWGAVGLGCQISRRVGVEVRDVVSRYDMPQGSGLQAPFSDGATEARTASVLQTGVIFRW